MSYSTNNPSAWPGFEYKTPEEGTHFYLPISVTTAGPRLGEFIHRVLLTVKETEGDYSLSFAPDIPNALELDAESKWEVLDVLCEQTLRFSHLFHEFPQTLSTSLKDWRKSKNRLRDVTDFLKSRKSLIHESLHGAYLGIGTDKDARQNCHTVCDGGLSNGLCETRHSLSDKQLAHLAYAPPGDSGRIFLDCEGDAIKLRTEYELYEDLYGELPCSEKVSKLESYKRTAVSRYLNVLASAANREDNASTDRGKISRDMRHRYESICGMAEENQEKHPFVRRCELIIQPYGQPSQMTELTSVLTQTPPFESLIRTNLGNLLPPLLMNDSDSNDSLPPSTRPSSSGSEGMDSTLRSPMWLKSDSRSSSFTDEAEERQSQKSRNTEGR